MSERVITETEREELTAYLDGETDPIVRAQIEAKLSRDPTLRAEADAMKRAWDLLDQLPQPHLSADFTHRTMSQLTVVTATPTAGKRLRNLPWGSVAAIAASLMIGWFVAGAIQRRQPQISANDPVLVRDLRVVDQLPLYAPVESLEFLKALDKPERFGEGTAP
jgi:anti-sigma factor RsiW